MTRPAEPVFWTNFAPGAPQSAPSPAATPAAGPAARAVVRTASGETSLDAIGTRFRSDKSSLHHGLLDFYERFLSEMRETAVAVMELGVSDGASVQMWEQYFPHARVLGVDERQEATQFVRGRIEVAPAQPGDMLRLSEIGTRFGPFDLIVDDWTHFWEHQIGAFRTMYPFVRPGGFYILEDIDTSYGDYVPTFRGEARISGAAYLKAMIDLVVANAPIEPEVKDDAFAKSAAQRTEFIAFHKGTALLRRRPG